MSILVVQPMKLGDLIQSTPLLAELKKMDLPLTMVVTRPEVAEAARICGLSDEVIQLDEERFVKNDFPAGALNKLTERPALLVNLSSSPYALAFVERFKADSFSGPQKGSDWPILPKAQRLASAVMTVDRRLGRLNLVDLWRLLAPAGAGSTRETIWPVEAETGLIPKNVPRPLIGLHLGSGNHLRRWPVERFVALARDLSPVGAVLLGSRSERSLARRFLDLWGSLEPQPIDLTGQTTLQSLGPVLKTLDLFVSADTGVMHMAAAVGTRVLAVFGGPALAGETGPYAPRSVIVQGYAQCSPCAESRTCPTRPCPALPPTEPVLAEARSILSQPPLQRAITSHDPSVVQANGAARSFIATSDDLGQTLVPARPSALSDSERLAMSLRESAAAILKPGHSPNPDLIKLTNYYYDPNSRPAHSLHPTVKAIAASAFDKSLDRKSFIDQTMATLELLDTNIKNR